MDAEWTIRDPDLRHLRKQVEFPYLVACQAAMQAGKAPTLNTQARYREMAIEQLESASQRGYRIAHQSDRERAFKALLNDERFEKLWAAMGGEKR